MTRSIIFPLFFLVCLLSTGKGLYIGSSASCRNEQNKPIRIGEICFLCGLLLGQKGTPFLKTARKYKANYKNIKVHLGTVILIDVKISGLTNIQLQSANQTSNTLLQISVRPEEEAIVFNSYVNNGWDVEEKRRIPFKDHTKILMEIEIEKYGFSIRINHDWFKYFDHRGPYTTINQVHIAGSGEDVPSVHKKQYGFAMMRSVIFPIFILVCLLATTGRGMIFVSSPGVTEHRCFLCELLFGRKETQHPETFNWIKARFTDVNITLGTEIYIDLEITKRTKISLESVDEKSNTPLHISIRPEEEAIVFNSFVNNGWDVEEKRRIPFSLNTVMSMKIEIEESCFLIRIGDDWCKSFDHRVPYTAINKIHIAGFGVMPSVGVKVS
ncbi:hypothetical protein CAEBREN_11969 [Caenorhabditis brenneri]|uniref:Galectin n=1 Tax=Caenorhabditis brenneri TaxID=135651 RepID=G0MPV4_CAEBE|nr:hypothetical protein CAEBREN_11969 [Caenorhabditis brenneri]